MKLLTFRKNSLGFTLVELLIVIVLISILASIGLASYTQARKQSRDSQRGSDLKNIQGALEQYYSDHNTYPATGHLNDLTTLPSSTTPYLRSIPTPPLTSSQTAYAYAGTGQTYCLGATMETKANTTSCGTGSYGLVLTQSD